MAKNSKVKTLAIGVLLILASTAIQSSVDAGGPGWVGVDWTVIDNGGLGLPGNNQYAWRCYDAHSNTMTAFTWTTGSSGGCPAGSYVPADNGRVVSTVRVRSHGLRCGELTLDNTGFTNAFSQVQLNWTLCSDPTGLTSTHYSSWFKGGFCVPADGCIYGYQQIARGPFAI